MRTHLTLGRLLILPAFLLLLAVAAACGDDDGGQDATPSPAPEPTAQGDDAESQVRLMLERLAYYVDNERFDDVCGLYSEAFIAAVGCDNIKTAVGGVSDVGDVAASLSSIDSIDVAGDQGEATYVMCLDVGSGPRCDRITVQVVVEAGEWKIGTLD